MNPKHLSRVAATLTLLSALALLLAAASVASAAPAVHDPGDGNASARAARDYWTPKRMRQAPLLNIERAASGSAISGSGLSRAAAPPLAPGATPPPAEIDPATSQPPTLPVAGNDGRAKRIEVPQFLTGQVPPEYLAYYPYSANGRVFGSFGRGGNYSCSATVVASASRSVALTAGHCLHDRDLGWARRVVFVPAYISGAAPYGTWSVGRKVVSRGWFRSQNFHGDYGAVKLSGPNGIIGDVVGQEGLAWSQPREQTFQAIGYPINRGDTEIMWNCISPFAGVDPLDRSRGAVDSGIGCDMGGGSSGGGWTIYDPYGNPYVNGVTSYGYKRLKNILFSAYLNGKVAGVVKSADRG